MNNQNPSSNYSRPQPLSTLAAVVVCHQPQLFNYLIWMVSGSEVGGFAKTENLKFSLSFCPRGTKEKIRRGV